MHLDSSGDVWSAIELAVDALAISAFKAPVVSSLMLSEMILFTDGLQSTQSADLWSAC